MRKSQLLLIIALMALLLGVSLVSKDISKAYFGGLPWYGWVGISIFLVIVGLGLALRDANRARHLLEEPAAPHHDENDRVSLISDEDLLRLDPALLNTRIR